MSRRNIICIRCPKGCRVNIDYTDNNENQKINNIVGYECPKGLEYVQEEFKNPTRIIPTTVKVKDGELPLVPVKTDLGVPKKLILLVMDEIADVEVEAPVKIGQVLKKNLLNTNVDLIATRNIRKRGETSIS